MLGETRYLHWLTAIEVATALGQLGPAASEVGCHTRPTVQPNLVRKGILGLLDFVEVLSFHIFSQFSQ